MIRIWVLAVALAAGCTIIMVGVNFFGADTLKFSAVAIGAAAAAVYLPGGVALSRVVYLFVGTLLGSLGFVIGAVALSDNNLGVYFGGVIPIFLAAIVGMWSRKPEVLLTLVLGIGAFSGAYTTTFFTDPQSLNYSLPITLGGTIVNVGIGYFLAAAVKVFYPVAEQDGESATATDGQNGDGDTAGKAHIPGMDDTQQLAASSDAPESDADQAAEVAAK